MTAPDFLPVLSAGGHENPRHGACVMEYVSILAGEPFSDSPSCTYLPLANAAQRINDALADSERHRLLPLIPKLIGTRGDSDERYREDTLLVDISWGREVTELRRRFTPLPQPMTNVTAVGEEAQVLVDWLTAKIDMRNTELGRTPAPLNPVQARLLAAAVS